MNNKFFHFTRSWNRPPFQPNLCSATISNSTPAVFQRSSKRVYANVNRHNLLQHSAWRMTGDKTRLTVQVLCSKLSSTMNSWSCPANPTYSPTDHPPLTIPHWPSGSNFKQRDRTIADWWDKQKGNRTTRLTSTDPRHDVCDVFERAAMDVLRSAVHLWHLVCDGHQWSQGAEQRVQ